MRERKSNLRNRKIIGVIITAIIAVCMITGSMSCISTTASANSKASYLKSYQKLVKKCSRKFTYSGSQAEMNREACAEYKLWDNELNRVYKKIKSSL
ncbi:MAG: lysozyme inhibitor LprI family protein, partial [Christensenellales bacterium]